ncbi:class I SAM-dependent DNA methyltransferase [Nocardia sp. NPDC020380]|uniref:class I SAM-dependent DNA methyltransferase n=1 Tax=Nocardia sp. NPDC020380 TaxID=3364309 RepID=UPI00378A96E8
MVERQQDSSLDAGQVVGGSSQAHVFDELVQRYEAAFSDRPEQVRAGAWVAEQVGRGARVLDVGCGSGIPTARQLVDAGLQVVGIDISAAMVSAASAAVPEATIHNCNILDLNETGFDGAVAFFSLLMLPRSDILRALAVLHRVIKPGGCLSISMVESDLDDTPVKFLDTDVRVSGYERDELRRVVEQAGFDIVEISVVNYTPAGGEPEAEPQLYVYARRASVGHVPGHPGQ